MGNQLIATWRLCGSSMLVIALALVSIGGTVMQDAKQRPDAQDEKVSQLIVILSDQKMRQDKPQHVIQAINQLGQMRSIAAIDSLVRLLTLRQDFEWEKPVDHVVLKRHPISVDGRYPAVGALIQIGKPSLPALAKVIETEEINSLASENAIYAVGIIFRDTPSAAVEYLREAATKASTPEAAKRLSNAAEKMKS